MHYYLATQSMHNVDLTKTLTASLIRTGVQIFVTLSLVLIKLRNEKHRPAKRRSVQIQNQRKTNEDFA